MTGAPQPKLKLYYCSEGTVTELNHFLYAISVNEAYHHYLGHVEELHHSGIGAQSL